MLNKKIIFITLFVCLFTISSVCATDNITKDIVGMNDADNVVSIDANNHDLNKINEETNLQEGNTITNGTFSDLANDINNASATLSITKNYVYCDNDSNYKNGIIIDKPLTIDGNGFKIDGLNKAHIFNITSNNVILNNITFCRGYLTNESTGSYGSLITDSHIGGGALHISGSNITITNCVFENNTAVKSNTYADAVSSAAIHSIGDILTIENTTFYNNHANRNGAIYILNNTKFNLINCRFIKNQGKDSDSSRVTSGALGIENSNGTIFNCSFIENTGGNKETSSAVTFRNSTITINNTYFYNNYYDYSVIISQNSNFTMVNSNISHSSHYIDNDNIRPRAYNYYITITNAGIKVLNYSKSKIEDSYFYTHQLGSIYIERGSELFLENNTILRNVIANHGIITSQTSINILNNSTLNYHINESVILNASIRDDNRNMIVMDRFNITENGNSLGWDCRPNKYGYSGTFYIPDDNKIDNNATYLKNITLPYGTHEINVEFYGYLTNCTIYTAIVNITKYDSKVEITSCENITTKEDLIVTFNIENETNASYVIKDGKGNIVKEGLIDSNNLTISNLTSGNYTIIISNNESDIYYASNASATFEVTKTASSIEIDDIKDTYCANNVTITFNVTNPTEISAIITNLDDGTNITFNNVTENIISQKLNAGQYKVTIYNKETEDYLASNATKEFNMTKANSKVEIISCENITYNENLLVNINIENRTNVSYTIKSVDGIITETGYIDSNNITIPGLISGNYTIKIENEESEIYYASYANATFEVKKATTSVEIDDINDTYCANNVTITFNITNPTEISAIITNLNDNTNITLENIKENTITQKLAAGTYKVTIYNKETENYLASNATKEFNMIKANSKVEINNIHNVTYNSTVTINFTVENRTVINVTIKNEKNETVFSEIVENTTITLNDLNASTYTVDITNSETETTYESNASASFEVKKATTSVEIDDINDTFCANNVTITFNVTNPTEISAIITNLNDNTNITLENIKENIITQKLAAGTYSITIYNKETENYIASNATKEFNMIKAGSKVDIDNIPDITYNSTVTINFTIENRTVINVTIKNEKNETVYSEIIENTTITLKDLNASTYTVDITNSETETTYESNASTTFEVKKATTSVEIDDINDTFCANNVTITFNVTNPTEISAIITNLNDNTNITLENIKENIITQKLAAGTYKVTIYNKETENYIASNATKEFNMIKAGSKVDIDNIPDITYNSTVTINFTIENRTVINVTVRNEKNETVYSEIVENTTITLKNLNSSTYTVEITNTESETILASNATQKFTVLKADSTVKGEDINVNYGETFTINVTSQNATAVSYSILDENMTEVASGNVTGQIDGLNLKTGTYTVNLTTVVDENHNQVTNTSSITINPLNSTVSADDITADFGSEITIIIMSENAIGINYIIIDVNGNITGEGYTTANITSLTLNAGTYTLNMTTVVDENHTSTTNTSTITINPTNSTVRAQNVTLTFGEDINIEITAENATGIKYIITDANGNITREGYTAGNITGITLNAGTYTVNLTTVVDENHINATSTSTITIKPANSTVKAENTEIIYSPNATIRIVSENATAVRYQIIKDGAVIQENTTVGSIEIANLGVGEYVLNMTALVDENHMSSANSTNITIYRASVDMSIVSPASIVIGENTTIIAVMASESINEGIITFYINGKVAKAVSVENGRANITFAPTAVREYDITATFTDDNYNTTINSTSIDVLAIETRLSIANPQSVYLNDDITFNITLSESIDGEIKFYIGNDTSIISEMTNGSCVITVSADATGTYSIFALYEGSANYTSSYAMGSYKVLGRTTAITASAVTTVYNGGKYLTATLKGQGGIVIPKARITISLNNKVYNLTTNAKGQVKISTDKIVPGAYVAKIAFAGNNKYLKSSKNVKVTVKKANIKMAFKLKTYKASVKTKKYYVVLRTNQNKVMKNTKITFKVNGKTFKGITNAKGVATVKVTNLVKKGIYTAVVKYPGTKLFNAQTKKVKITVLK